MVFSHFIHTLNTLWNTLVFSNGPPSFAQSAIYTFLCSGEDWQAETIYRIDTLQTLFCHNYGDNSLKDLGRQSFDTGSGQEK